MPNADRAKVTLHDHLATQAAQADQFLATVEGLPNQRVRVTPWGAAGGCLCELAFVVEEAAIHELAYTGDLHGCCGKQLKVVEVTFTEPYKAVAKVVGQQAASGKQRVAPLSLGTECSDWCENNLRTCLRTGVDSEGDPASKAQCAAEYRRCQQVCQHRFGAG